MKVCLSLRNGRLVYSPASDLHDGEEIPQEISVPQAVPGKGFVLLTLDYFGTKIDPKEGECLLYVERVSDASH
jgi:hypothetical protein